MTESSSMKDWQLEESSDAESQWQLLDTEQELPAEMKLQEGTEVQEEWQPVEYASTEASGRRNWILPSFIILAMIAVVAYIAWLGFSGVGFLPTDPTAAEPTTPVEEPSAGPIAAVAAATEAPAPTATPIPEPTVTVEPTPEPLPTSPMVEQQFATINSPYGLNARASDSPDGEVLAILDDGDVFVVIAEGGERTQIELDDGTRAFVATEFITITAQMVPVEEVPGAVVEPADDAAEGTVSGQAEGEAVTSSESTTPETAAKPTIDVEPPEPFTNDVPDGPVIYILAADGVNARSEPSADAEILLTIPQGAALPATVQSEDGVWLQIELPTGTLAWVFVEAVETAGPVESLPVAGAEAESAPSTAEEAVDAETDAEAPDAATEGDAGGDGEAPQITVDSLISIKARTSPALDADVAEMLSNGTTLPATGRTADNAWVRVQLSSGEDAWLLVGAVVLNVEPTTLPVVEP